jgi:hypothetical protein
VSTPARPRHARKEIRAFADELDRGGWTFETVDASGHTIWSHPRANGRYKLPETPRHFDVQRARRDVARLIGQKVPGKRNGKPKPQKGERRDFALERAVKEGQERQRGRAEQTRRADERPVPTGPAVSVRRTPRRLPWEDQPYGYDRGIDRLMRETPR